MNRSALSLAAASLLLAIPTFAQTPWKLTPRTRPVTQAEVDAITRDAILIDTHNDVPSHTITGYDIAGPRRSETDLPSMRGYLGAEFFSIFVGANFVNGNHSANRALQMIDTTKTDIIAKYPNDFVFSTTAADIERAHKEHKIAALMGIEGGHAIENSLRLLRDFYDLGVRYMTLTHFNTNDWADAQGDFTDPKVVKHGGLTDFGKDVVREMNRLGMMVDISHTADATFYAAIATSTAPIIASHSSCRSVDSHTRNMTDDMLRALAKNGGTVQINFECSYLSQRYLDYVTANPPVRGGGGAAGAPPDPEARAKARAEALIKNPPATLKDVVAHINHAVEIAGIDHVGIGTDFDGSSCVPSDLNSYDKFPALTRALLEQGYTAEDIKKIYGGNLLRVMRAVEKRAQELKGTPAIETKFPGEAPNRAY